MFGDLTVRKIFFYFSFLIQCPIYLIFFKIYRIFATFNVYFVMILIEPGYPETPSILQT